ncbi:MAG: class I SAM-dependent methyltransferase [Campylobacterales bacterium]|nr:class I SAM-dependent methyltransferase [Campylobacterales bacterium]
MNQTKDHFEHKSKTWDMNSKRVKNAGAIADAIIATVELKSDMKIADFGAGTGLLSYFVAPYVDTIVAIDNSPSMLEMFKLKCNEFECKTIALECDLSQDEIRDQYDGIISSMTLHHIANQQKLFDKMYGMIKEGGFIALADLDKEDGTFHEDNTGVFHFGFNREELSNIVYQAGFKEVKFETVSVIKKPHREFSIFLLTAYK